MAFQNFIQKDEFPYEIPSGTSYDSGDYHAVLNKTEKLANISSLISKRDQIRAEGKFAGIGIIVLLISVFPANIYLYMSEVPQKIYGITKNDALLRLPFQLPLILLAYWHSKEKTSKTFDLFSIFIFIPTIIYFLTL